MRTNQALELLKSFEIPENHLLSFQKTYLQGIAHYLLKDYSELALISN